MSKIQFILTIAVCAAATMLTRFLPFLVFGSRGGKVPEVVEYLGHVLPAAIFGMLIVYCLKGVSLTSGSHGIPEAIAIGGGGVDGNYQKMRLARFMYSSSRLAQAFT